MNNYTNIIMQDKEEGCYNIQAQKSETKTTEVLQRIRKFCQILHC